MMKEMLRTAWLMSALLPPRSLPLPVIAKLVMPTSILMLKTRTVFNVTDRREKSFLPMEHAMLAQLTLMLVHTCTNASLTSVKKVRSSPIVVPPHRRVKELGARIVKCTMLLMLKEQPVSDHLAEKVKKSPNKVPVRHAQNSMDLTWKQELNV
jgi:hypothetical protein